MRVIRMLLILLFAVSPAMAAPAQESALVIRATDLKAQPFIDAANVAPVTANQPVTIIQRRGGWANVQANGKTGWLRTLNLRLAPGTSGAPARGASSLRTGSSGKTVTTGVKGLDEEQIRNATVDREQLAALGTLGVTEGDARAAAAGKRLSENKLGYLKPGKVKK